MGNGIEERGFQTFALAFGFGFTDLFDGPGTLDGNSNHRANGIQSLPGESRAGNTQAADGLDAEPHRQEVERFLRFANDFVANESILHLFFIELRGTISGAIEFAFLRDEKLGGPGAEAFHQKVGNGVHQLDNVPFPKQFLAEGVETFDFAAAAVGGIGFLANPGGQLTPHDRGKQEGEQSDPILRIRNGEGADGREKKIIEEQHRGNRHGDGDDHAPDRRNC